MKEVSASSSLKKGIQFLLLIIVTGIIGSTTAAATSNQDDDLTNLPFTPNPDTPPSLTGHHFKITVIEEAAFVNLQVDEASGEIIGYSGYLIDIIKELAARANFTYELRTPSGYGSLCQPRLTTPNSTEAYGAYYRQNYRCGECDVNDRPFSHYSTDWYVGAYYITPQRLRVNKYTIPYSPPDRASLGMMGTATHISTIHDLKKFPHYKVCAQAGTAYMESLQKSFPHLNVQGIEKDQSTHTALSDGTCDIIIDSYPHLFRNVLNLKKEGKCFANGKPVGVIGEPLDYGLNYFAFGLRKDLSDEVVEALNFWLQALMACFPQDPNGYCPNGQGSLSAMYYASESGGRGDECGYVQFPTPDSAGNQPLSPAAIAGIAITPVALVLVVGIIYHVKQMREQERRLKKRFVQQLARNIDIADNSGLISASKLAETYEHIGGQDGLISKEDMAKWINDLHMDFLSEAEFDHLWAQMDVTNTGMVDPVEFFSFLRECDDAFKEVHNEMKELPKTERMKLAARRLSNIKRMGLEEVEKMERRNDRRSRQVFDQGSNVGNANTTGNNGKCGRRTGINIMQQQQSPSNAARQFFADQGAAVTSAARSFFAAQNQTDNNESSSGNNPVTRGGSSTAILSDTGTDSRQSMMINMAGDDNNDIEGSSPPKQPPLSDVSSTSSADHEEEVEDVDVEVAPPKPAISSEAATSSSSSSLPPPPAATGTE